ncbi:MAG: acetyl-CoA carboxylase, carboxyltransferase subunit beta [Parvularculaceae bacterium]
MNWLSDITLPGIKKIFRKQDDNSDTLWTKCGSCAEMIFEKDLAGTQHVCPACGHHMKLTPKERLDHLFDDGQWHKIELPDVPADPLKFKDEKKYADRLKDYRKRTGEKDALVIGSGTLNAIPAVCVVQNFAFMGGSMGMGLGEGILTAAETAIKRKSALIIFTASGGARMQEGILSLMQMPRTTIAVQMLREAGLPYIVVLTNPTTGGVTASYAMLGDVQLAEPGALIGFAGPRVIEQTIREKLPEGFQRAEYLNEHGMVDLVVSRAEMKQTLSNLIRVLTKHGAKASHRDPVVALPSPGAKQVPEEIDVEVLDKAAE